MHVRRQVVRHCNSRLHLDPLMMSLLVHELDYGVSEAMAEINDYSEKGQAHVPVARNLLD